MTAAKATIENTEIAKLEKRIRALTKDVDKDSLRALLKKLGPVKFKKNKKGKDIPTAPDTVGEFIKWFATASEDCLYDVKRGQWECRVGNPGKEVAHTLVFHSALLKGEKCDKASDIIMLRSTAKESMKVPIFNASRITYGTSYAAQKDPQERAEEYGAVPVPFETVVEMANLNLAKVVVLDWTGAERMFIPPVGRYYQYTNSVSSFDIINRHFAGAVVLRIEDKYFLFDTDREELKYHNFNPFFTQLPCAVKNVSEAYQALMPVEVKDALAKGLAVLRQGEFFFVPVSDKEVEDICRSATSHPASYTDVTLPHIVGIADEMAARAFNMDLVQRRAAVTKWLKAYKPDKNTDPTIVIKEPRDTVAAYLTYLTRQVGSSRSHVPQAVVQSYERLNYWPHNTFENDLDTELRMRLREGTGIDSDYQIRLHASLTVTTTDNVDDTRRSNGHQITLVCVDPKDPMRRYARGRVEHRGRQHHDLYLPQWYRIFANTATANYTVHGDVD